MKASKNSETCIAADGPKRAEMTDDEQAFLQQLIRRAEELMIEQIGEEGFKRVQKEMGNKRFRTRVKLPTSDDLIWPRDSAFPALVKDLNVRLGLDQWQATRLNCAANMFVTGAEEIAKRLHLPPGVSAEDYAFSLPRTTFSHIGALHALTFQNEPDRALAGAFLDLKGVAAAAIAGDYISALSIAAAAIEILIAAISRKELLQTEARVAGEEAAARSSRAKKAADASHAEHRKRQPDARAFYESKTWKFKTHAIAELQKKYNVSYKTAEKWIADWGKKTP